MNPQYTGRTAAMHGIIKKKSFIFWGNINFKKISQDFVMVEKGLFKIRYIS